MLDERSPLLMALRVLCSFHITRHTKHRGFNVHSLGNFEPHHAPTHVAHNLRCSRARDQRLYVSLTPFSSATMFTNFGTLIVAAPTVITSWPSFMFAKPSF